jgi:hypothetical protein
VTLFQSVRHVALIVSLRHPVHLFRDRWAIERGEPPSPVAGVNALVLGQGGVEAFEEMRFLAYDSVGDKGIERFVSVGMSVVLKPVVPGFENTYSTCTSHFPEVTEPA